MWDLIVSVPDHGLSFYLGAVLLQDEMACKCLYHMPIKS